MAPSSTILLLLVIASVAHGSLDADTRCPTPCTCDVLPSHVVQADCGGQQLDNIPTTFPDNTNRLILNDNSLRTLSNHAFRNRNLEKLKKFYCSGCALESIDDSAFADLNSLRYIDLSSNKFKEFSPIPFKIVKHLRVVVLKDNEGLDCDKVKRSFKTISPKVIVKCSAENYRTKRTPANEDEDAFFDDVFNRTNVNASDSSRRSDVGGNETNTAQDDGEWVPVDTSEDATGWGVGTYVVLAVLVVIICLVCFKFVFLKLRKRWKKRAREAAWREQDREDEEREREEAQ